MALIVEDGTIVPNADSLASVDFADLYHSNRGNSLWAQIAMVEAKEQLLRKATDYVVVKFQGAWKGDLVSSNQHLPFPRIVSEQNIGVPDLVKQAICELALSASNSPLMPNIVRGKKKVKIASLEVEYDGNSSTATNFVAATLRFKPFLDAVSNGFTSKLVRS